MFLVCVCSVILLCSVSYSQKMSIPLSNQDMEELPSPNTPLPEPNLNFTVQVHSLLNGESPAINSPDNNILGAPVSILETEFSGGEQWCSRYQETE